MSTTQARALDIVVFQEPNQIYSKIIQDDEILRIYSRLERRSTPSRKKPHQIS